ncbi:hypothetical protein FNW02_19410 [Komarekiella sp. 'clone 1']|uniref:Uncharacterized protein n=1 Tax=Komarekiella delphini-convector SJRDD-AB1 TaxID=2593771 RepID=A0AA40SZN1_9NOST|nr:hypothetical protein [Komarekiella delphini-convector]MBD6617932.1 hypothetical protein [Komarekiella delphini-convector SJRDD-AB1]
MQQPLIALIAVIVLIGIVWLSALNWRLTVKVTLIIVIFEGVLRKWVLPQATEQIYFLKDLLLLVAYLSYYFSPEPKYPFKWSIFNIVLIMVLSWSVFQAFNPSLGSPIIGIFGLKAYFFYVPLMWILPSLFQSEEELYKFLRNYLLLAIPVCLLATVQYFSPPSSPINIYAGGKGADALAGGAVRVTGTFPYIAGYSTYLSFCFSILIPLLTLPQKPLWRLLTLIEAFLVVATSFMTGARGLLAFEVLFLLGYVCILSFTHLSEFIRSVKSLLIPIILISALVPRFFGKAIETFSSRLNDEGAQQEFSSRALSSFSTPDKAMQEKGLDGYGIGATHQGSGALRNAFKLPIGEPPPVGEKDAERVLIELGPFGLLLWYGLRLIILFSTFQVLLKLKNPFLQQLGTASLLFQAINFPAQLAFNNTYAIYYWFLTGFMLLLPELEYREFFYSKYWTQQQQDI